MKLKHLLPFLAMAAGIFAGCSEKDAEFLDEATKDELAVSPASQKIAKDGTASFTFTLTLTSPSGTVYNLKETNTTATVSFEATGGSVSPASATTDENGQVTVTFTAPDPKTFTGGTVKGVVKNVKGVVDQQGNLATATAEVLPRDASDDKPIDRAVELKDNTYAIEKGGELIGTYPLSQTDSRWYVARASMDKTKEALKMELMDEDPVQSTMGWGMWELPTDLNGQVTNIDESFTSKYSWAAGKFGSFRSGKQLSAHMGKGGNVKSGQIQIKTRTKGYSGEYQFLFILVFENESWDSATQTNIPDGEYTIYGNAIVNEYKPVLNSFMISAPADWVQVGKSITVDADWWDDGAEFDWSKVKLIAQEKGQSSSQDVDEGYFQWSASDHTLKAVKSSNDVNVYLKFQYGETDMKTSCQIATGPGWDYTSFSFEPARLVMDKYDAMYLNVDKYAPTNLTWNWAAIEIDPESDPTEAFWLDKNIHKLYNFSGKAGQTYNLRFRIRSNYSVGAPLEVYVVDQKPDSFEITYQQNGTYKPWANGSPDGICNYGMGLSLGVETKPADCYWNWADVELIPGYDNTFSFSGVGGRDDHPKLMLKTSHDGTHPGTQVGFRLKYDHSKTSYIYVTHN